MGIYAYEMLMNPSNPYGPPAPSVVEDLTWNCWEYADGRIALIDAYHWAPWS